MAITVSIIRLWSPLKTCTMWRLAFELLSLSRYWPGWSTASVTWIGCSTVRIVFLSHWSANAGDTATPVVNPMTQSAVTTIRKPLSPCKLMEMLFFHYLVSRTTPSLMPKMALLVNRTAPRVPSTRKSFGITVLASKWQYERSVFFTGQV